MSLFPIIDSALADSAARSGHWLACKPGCHQCCIGVFPISQFDATNLRQGLLQAAPEVRSRIETRAHAARLRLQRDFPGDLATGILFTQPHHEEAFDDFANDEPCPVLDPATGTCDLYASRPVQCRTFGPPVRDEDDSLTVCELCFINADPTEAARCELDQSWRPLEETLIAEAEQHLHLAGQTLIAFALTANQPPNEEPA